MIDSQWSIHLPLGYPPHSFFNFGKWPWYLQPAYTQRRGWHAYALRCLASRTLLLLTFHPGVFSNNWTNEQRQPLFICRSFFYSSSSLFFLLVFLPLVWPCICTCLFFSSVQRYYCSWFGLSGLLLISWKANNQCVGFISFYNLIYYPNCMPP